MIQHMTGLYFNDKQLNYLRPNYTMQLIERDTILVYDLIVIVMVKLLITYTKMTIVFDKSYRVDGPLKTNVVKSTPLEFVHIHEEQDIVQLPWGKNNTHNS